METIKTAVVVVLLLAVLYGVYVVLKRPELGSSTETAWESAQTVPPDIEEGPPPLDPNAPQTAPQESYPVRSVPEMPQASYPQAAEAMPTAVVTDQQPTLAEPPPGSFGESKSPPELTPIPVAAVEPEEAEPQDQRGPSLYEALPTGAVEREAVAIATDNPEPLQGKAPHLEDGKEDTIGAQPNRVFQDAWETAVGQLEKEQWQEALLTLSLRYNDPEVTGETRSRLMDLLDPLAGKVIYSAEHTLEPPYEIRVGDSLQGIAERYQIPVNLLQNVNGIYDPLSLQPGTQLKVLRGPFRGEIDRKQGELVLFLGDYYAGRFAISVGNDPEPKPAEYQVKAKQPGREYYAPDQSTIPAKARDNPYGNWWIGLGGDVCVHGSPESTPTHGGFGCVSLSSADAADVYHILTVGSKVVIR